MNIPNKIGFIGFGLIGGSIARAMKKYMQSCHITVFNNRGNKENKSLEVALADKVIDTISLSLTDSFPECDIIFLCAPVLSNIKYLKELKDIIKDDCILTDVGSVKENIHIAVCELGLTKNFIGGHPMAGSEKTGYMNSNALILENAYYILTPTSDTKQSYIDIMVKLVNDIKALPIILDYKEHDKITAAVSHVPHIIAAELVNLIRYSDDENEKMRMLAAGGFKDITRIASSSPLMWQNICLTNSDSIKKILDSYIERLKKVSDALVTIDEDYLHNIFETAAIYRDSIPNEGRGLMNKSYKLSLDVEDKPGSIAIIADILAKKNISIKNIGISHNREYQPGALCIEFYNEDALMLTYDVLTANGFTIYEYL